MFQSLADEGYETLDSLVGATYDTFSPVNLPEKGAHKTFLKRVLLAVNPPPDAPQDGVGARAQPKKKVTVNVVERLKAESVTKGLKDTLHPLQAAADKVAVEVADLKEKGALNPFVYSDLRNFAPAWANRGGDLLAVDQEEPTSVAAELRKELGLGSKNTTQLLTLPQWAVAYQTWSKVAAATGSVLRACV